MQYGYQNGNKVHWCERQEGDQEQSVWMGKSCLTSQSAFYGGTAGWIDEGRVVGVVHLDFRRAFDTLSYDILTGRLRECRLDTWAVKWFESCVTSCPKRLYRLFLWRYLQLSLLSPEQHAPRDPMLPGTLDKMTPVVPTNTNHSLWVTKFQIPGVGLGPNELENSEESD